MSKWLSASKRNLVALKTNGLCGYCGSDVDTSSCTVDHINPKAQGGANQVSNLVIACKSCNSSKRSLSIEDYRTWVAWRSIAQIQSFSIHQIKWLLDNTDIADKFNIADVRFFFENIEGVSI